MLPVQSPHGQRTRKVRCCRDTTTVGVASLKTITCY
nr:MAG TPA_asm: hypothetical protein [Caudoviricetes sp.]